MTDKIPALQIWIALQFGGLRSASDLRVERTPHDQRRAFHPSSGHLLFDALARGSSLSLVRSTAQLTRYSENNFFRIMLSRNV
jgi:hypothetical protein